jgi:hypothetical protein
MNRRATPALVALPAALLLAGCASSTGNFPSLAIRDAERVSGTITVPATPAAARPPAPAATELAALMAAIREGHARFTGGTAAARRVVAAANGAGVGSDSWSAAQVAVADLEGERSQVMIALADLDRLYASASVAGADVTATAAALAEANALVEQENAEIARLLGALAN